MNMIKADRIGHLCIMSRANIEHTRAAHLTEQFGYLENLNQIALEGGFITAETEEFLGMTNSATDLIRLAKSILETRDRLAANNRPIKLEIVS